MRGGSKPGERRGGRQRGTKNKRTVERERALIDAAVKIAGALGSEAFQGDAHAFLVWIYKDAAQPIELRIEAAKAAIGYEKPRLASVEGKVEGTLSLEKLVMESIALHEQRSAVQIREE